MENMNGCKAKFIITVGSLSVITGENEAQPGQYKVWAQEQNEEAPVWERSFDKLNHAAGFLCGITFPKNAARDG